VNAMITRLILRYHVAALLVLALSLAGCGGGAPNRALITASVENSQAETKNTEVAALTAGEASKDEKTTTAEELQRKIIYSATVELVVKELDPVMAEVAKLAEQNKAYIAASEIRGQSGSARSAGITLRVPVHNFGRLKQSLLALGIPERDMIKSEDVTEEFYDLQGRLKNLRSSQERLIELKKQATVKEILEIEPQLEKVNEKLEAIQGRIKYLTTFASLSTINLSMREIKDYKPPTAPTFGDRIGSTFHDSWEGLVTFSQGAVLFLVALVVWSPLLVPGGVLGVWLLRRRRRNRQQGSSPTVASKPLAE